MNHLSHHIEETVSVTASRNYDVLIGKGLLEDLGALSSTIVAPGKAVLVTDDTVNALYGDTVEQSLASAGTFGHAVGNFGYLETSGNRHADAHQFPTTFKTAYVFFE